MHAKLWSLLVAGSLIGSSSPAQSPHFLSVAKGEVSFVSQAPLERISATNDLVNGVLDLAARTFAVRIPMRGFEGFNSPLQKEHFHENYLESKLYPNALFEGRIIEAVALDSLATYHVRAKGEFTMHGVRKERIVPCTIVVSKEGVRVRSEFPIALADHGIRIPRVVEEKLAPSVNVKVSLLFRSPLKKP